MELINDTQEMDLGEKQSYDRLMDGKDIRYKTEFTQEQRSAIAVLENAYKFFKSKGLDVHVLKNFLLSYIELGASVDRKSRLEVVDALKAKVDFMEKMQQQQVQQQQIR